MKRNYILLFILLVVSVKAISQEVNLDSMLDVQVKAKNENETQYAEATFKTSRLIDGHTVETTQKGILDLKISHRFGTVTDGLYDMFGMDEATMRIGADYGVTKRFTIGFGRSTFEKQYDGFLKYRLLWQSTGLRNTPVSITLLSSVMLKTLRQEVNDKSIATKDKLSYAYQVLIARKFNSAFSLQVMPVLIHENLVDSSFIDNNIYAIGTGARLKLTKRSSINIEYYYNIPDHKIPGTFNTLSLGYEIETGGHVFQFHLSNSIGMTERTFIAENKEGRWGFDNKNSVHLGFNISRVFTIVKPKDLKM